MSVKRTITSVVYVIVVAALCAAKWLIPSGGGNYLFDALFCAISVLGAIEVTRALGFISYLQRYVAILFCGFSIPVYLAFELTMSAGVSGIAYVLGAGALFICVLFVADHASSNLKSTLGALFTLLYAGLLPLILSVINHMETNLSMLAIMVL